MVKQTQVSYQTEQQRKSRLARCKTVSRLHVFVVQPVRFAEPRGRWYKFLLGFNAARKNTTQSENCATCIQAKVLSCWYDHVLTWCKGPL